MALSGADGKVRRWNCLPIIGADQYGVRYASINHEAVVSVLYSCIVLRYFQPALLQARHKLSRSIP